MTAPDSRWVLLLRLADRLPTPARGTPGRGRPRRRTWERRLRRHLARQYRAAGAVSHTSIDTEAH